MYWAGSVYLRFEISGIFPGIVNCRKCQFSCSVLGQLMPSYNDSDHTVAESREGVLKEVINQVEHGTRTCMLHTVYSTTIFR